MEALKKLINNKYFVLVSRVVLGGVFVLAGGAKLMEPIADFIAIGRSWDIIPDPLLTWYMTALPWVEVIFGLLLIIGAFVRFSSVVISLSTVSFIIGIVVNMTRGRTLEDCGCFGDALHFGDTFGQLLWRDLVLLALAIVLIITSQKWLSVDGWFSKSKNLLNSQ